MRVQASLSNIVIASGASFICLLRCSRAMDMKGSSFSVSEMLPTCSCPVVVRVCTVTVLLLFFVQSFVNNNASPASSWNVR